MSADIQWGEDETDNVRYEQRNRIYAARRAEEIARKAVAAAAWTVEVTTARRADWNAWVKATLAAVPAAKRAQTIAAQEAAQGWTMTGLKEAIARHGL